MRLKYEQEMNILFDVFRDIIEQVRDDNTERADEFVEAIGRVAKLECQVDMLITQSAFAKLKMVDE